MSHARCFLVLLATALLSQVTGLKLNSKSIQCFNRWVVGGAACLALVAGDPTAILADARLNAPTAIGTRVNSDAESLLRYGLPLPKSVEKDVRDIQGSIESLKSNLKMRRVEFARNDLKNAKSLLKKYGSSIIDRACPPSRKTLCVDTLAKLDADVSPVNDAISAESDAGSGSQQQRDALDNAFAAQGVLSRDLSQFEELLVPENFKKIIPEEYVGLPALQGRAEVAMVIRKPDNSQFNVDGKLYDKVNLLLVVDGYNAPLTGGNFVDLVNRGFYNNKAITRSDGFVVQTGDADPAGEVHGFVPPGATEERKIPLEISLKGDSELLYGSTSEDDSRGYAAAVLPFQSYGALGMARSEFEANSASSQFFWLLFESDLTPAGKNMLDGRYACFGYTLDGADLLKDVKEGDIIASAKVVRGADKLIAASAGK